MAFLGADVEQLRSLAAEFGRQSGALDEMGRRLTMRVDLVGWRGADAERFRDDWRSVHLVTVRRAAEALGRAGVDARRQANAQQDASAR